MKTKETSQQLKERTTNEIKKVVIQSTREQALDWWGNIEYKNLIASKHGDITQGRTHQNLTGREIEEIWRKETQQNFIDKPQSKEIKAALDMKYNQKQFKKFDRELFKKYIDKFSDEDRYLATIELINSLSVESQKKLWNELE